MADMSYRIAVVSPYRRMGALVMAALFVALAAATGWALWLGRLDSVAAIAAVVLGGLAIASFGLFVFSLEGGEGVGVESHWGGLGGSVGGWRLTTPLVFLLLTVFFAGAMTAAIGAAQPPAKAERPAAAPAAEPAGTSGGEPAPEKEPAG